MLSIYLVIASRKKFRFYKEYQKIFFNNTWFTISDELKKPKTRLTQKPVKEYHEIEIEIEYFKKQEKTGKSSIQ
jgi:hypothetical protein